jgi:hypothetical protein
MKERKLENKMKKKEIYLRMRTLVTMKLFILPRMKKKLSIIKNYYQELQTHGSNLQPELSQLIEKKLTKIVRKFNFRNLLGAILKDGKGV